MLSESAYALFLKVFQILNKINLSPFKNKKGLLIHKNRKYPVWIFSCFFHGVNGLYFLNQAYEEYKAEKIHFSFLSLFISLTSIASIACTIALEKGSAEFVPLTNSLIGDIKREFKNLFLYFNAFSLNSYLPDR